MNPQTSQELKNIASKIINKMPSKSDDERFGFVITTLMIISIILTLVRVIQECDKKKTENFTTQEKYEFFGQQTKSLSLRKSWFTRMTIKKIIRKEMSISDYRTYSYDLMNAILSVGENLTQDESKTLVEATNV